VHRRFQPSAPASNEPNGGDPAAGRRLALPRKQPGQRVCDRSTCRARSVLLRGRYPALRRGPTAVPGAASASTHAWPDSALAGGDGATSGGRVRIPQRPGREVGCAGISQTFAAHVRTGFAGRSPPARRGASGNAQDGRAIGMRTTSIGGSAKVPVITKAPFANCARSAPWSIG